MMLCFSPRFSRSEQAKSAHHVSALVSSLRLVLVFRHAREASSPFRQEARVEAFGQARGQAFAEEAFGQARRQALGQAPLASQGQEGEGLDAARGTPANESSNMVTICNHDVFSIAEQVFTYYVLL